MFEKYVAGITIELEANFFTGTGSKLDIETSYVHRQSLLKDSGWGFILLTDGAGWKKTVSILRQAVEKLDYVLNLDFIKQGMLDRILMKR